VVLGPAITKPEAKSPPESRPAGGLASGIAGLGRAEQVCRLAKVGNRRTGPIIMLAEWEALQPGAIHESNHANLMVGS